MYSDDEYVAGIQRGDEMVFTALVHAYIDPLTRFVFGMTGTLDAANDIVQEIFAAVWRLREAWEPKGSVIAYLLTAARHRVVNSTKASQARQRLLDAWRLQLETADTAGEGNELFDRLTDDTLVMLVRRELQTLTGRQRDALRLRYEQELTIPQIGAVLGIDTRATRRLIARALVTLRARLASIQPGFE